jgi:outer membrane lipoprotein carrier protein
MDKKVIFIYLMVLISGFNVHAQLLVPANEEQKQFMLGKITAAAAGMESLVCDFEQIKELSILNEKMISTGKMYYRNDNSLRWEYQRPYTYVFVLNEKKILMQSEQTRSVIDVNSSGFFQELVNIMINGINGNGLKDNKNFNISYFVGESQWSVTLTPVQKEVKKLFSTITLTFNVQDYTVDKIAMKEKNGDSTLILLSKKQFNKKIENEKYAID